MVVEIADRTLLQLAGAATHGDTKRMRHSIPTISQPMSNDE
jgi:hypothetical protein